MHKSYKVRYIISKKATVLIFWIWWCLPGWWRWWRSPSPSPPPPGSSTRGTAFSQCWPLNNNRFRMLDTAMSSSPPPLNQHNGKLDTNTFWRREKVIMAGWQIFVVFTVYIGTKNNQFLSKPKTKKVLSYGRLICCKKIWC